MEENTEDVKKDGEVAAPVEETTAPAEEKVEEAGEEKTTE